MSFLIKAAQGGKEGQTLQNRAKPEHKSDSADSMNLNYTYSKQH